MARRGRPKFKPTPAQREKVMRLRADGWSIERIARSIGTDHETLRAAFPAELEHGADIKRAELLEYADKAAKKGNVAAIKWLSDQRSAARAANQLEERASKAPASSPEVPVAPKLGKKQAQQQAAEKVTGKFAPPAPPKPLLN